MYAVAAYFSVVLMLLEFNKVLPVVAVSRFNEERTRFVIRCFSVAGTASKDIPDIKSAEPCK